MLEVHNKKWFGDYCKITWVACLEKENFWAIHYHEVTAFMRYEQKAVGAQGKSI